MFGASDWIRSRCWCEWLCVVNVRTQLALDAHSAYYTTTLQAFGAALNIACRPELRDKFFVRMCVCACVYSLNSSNVCIACVVHACVFVCVRVCVRSPSSANWVRIENWFQQPTTTQRHSRTTTSIRTNRRVWRTCHYFDGDSPMLAIRQQRNSLAVGSARKDETQVWWFSHEVEVVDRSKSDTEEACHEIRTQNNHVLLQLVACTLEKAHKLMSLQRPCGDFVFSSFVRICVLCVLHRIAYTLNSVESARASTHMHSMKL